MNCVEALLAAFFYFVLSSPAGTVFCLLFFKKLQRVPMKPANGFYQEFVGGPGPELSCRLGYKWGMHFLCTCSLH